MVGCDPGRRKRLQGGADVVLWSGDEEPAPVLRVEVDVEGAERAAVDRDLGMDLFPSRDDRKTEFRDSAFPTHTQLPDCDSMDLVQGDSWQLSQRKSP